MKIITDSIWYYCHSEKLKFLEKNKGIYNLIHNQDEVGKINLCINPMFNKKDEQKYIPLAKYLVDNNFIEDDGHYYVEYNNVNYSVFIVGSNIFPFSDRACSNELIEFMNKTWCIENKGNILLDEKRTMVSEKDKLMINLSVLVLSSVVIISLSFMLSFYYINFL